MFIDTIFITSFSSSSSESVLSQAIASGPSCQTAKNNVGANFHTIKNLHVRGYTFSFPFFLVSAGAVNVEGRTDVDGTDTTAARVDVDGTTGDPILESEDADTGLLVEL